MYPQNNTLNIIAVAPYMEHLVYVYIYTQQLRLYNTIYNYSIATPKQIETLNPTTY